MSSNEMFALQTSRLNPFLFSEVGIEPSGQMLSVASLIARQGKDPWNEAARLAAMPAAAAIECLGRAIAMMPASPWPLPAATVIAGRLVAVLPAPGAGSTAFGPHRNVAGFTQQTWIAVVFALALMLGVMAMRSWLAL